MVQTKRFGVMLDCSRNAVMKVCEVKNFATVIKAMGYNMIQLYTEDTYEVEGEPFFGYFRGRYTTEELNDIVSYCNSIGIEVIPCIQTLAHLNQIFRWFEYNSINDCTDILLLEEPRTYQLIENMFKSLRKSFTTDTIHIGMDEAHMLGLGKYLDKHGYTNRFDLLKTHLDKVCEIASKYSFKPIMWSDMFFRLANKGEYYLDNPSVSEEAKASVPENLGLVYWDYYHKEEKFYEGMMNAHLKFNRDIWFAGGAWVWAGFASGNKTTLDTMLPAMKVASTCGIDNVLITMWGDNGKECSFYSVLPSLFAIKKYYDGERDMDKIKSEFFEITGESFDAMLSLDEPNFIEGNDSVMLNLSKYMLYSDPFLGFLDSTVVDGAQEQFSNIAKKLEDNAKNSPNYSYIFESSSKLCKVLELKYDLGYNLRIAYKNNDLDKLCKLLERFDPIIERIDDFYNSFKTLWFKENKPHGFDVQDQRLGGLKQRMISCKQRLKDYIDKKIDEIPELNEELLCFHGNGKDYVKKPACFNFWTSNVTINNM